MVRVNLAQILQERSFRTNSDVVSEEKSDVLLNIQDLKPSGQ